MVDIRQKSAAFGNYRLKESVGGVESSRIPQTLQTNTSNMLELRRFRLVRFSKLHSIRAVSEIRIHNKGVVRRMEDVLPPLHPVLFIYLVIYFVIAMATQGHQGAMRGSMK